MVDVFALMFPDWIESLRKSNPRLSFSLSLFQHGLGPINTYSLYVTTKLFPASLLPFTPKGLERIVPTYWVHSLDSCLLLSEILSIFSCKNSADNILADIIKGFQIANLNDIFCSYCAWLLCGIWIGWQFHKTLKSLLPWHQFILIFYYLSFSFAVLSFYSSFWNASVFVFLLIEFSLISLLGGISHNFKCW